MSFRNTALHVLLVAGSISAFVPTPSLNGPAYHVSQRATPLSSASIMEDQMISTPEDQVTQATTYLDDGFVFGLEGSGLERQKGKVSQVYVEGDSLETQPWQVALVSGTFLGQAAIGINAIAQLYAKTGGDVFTTGVESALTVLMSWVLADLVSGILHWSGDNYGNGRTPIVGNIIAAFQGHHTAPWTITERGFCNNVSKITVPFGVPTVAVISLLAGSEHSIVALFSAFFCAMAVMSQECHKWSHMTKGEVPSIVNWLQKTGVILDRRRHALHHTMPFEGTYCLLSGFCNEALDNSGFFRRLEHIVYKINGIESNSWKLDPELREKTLRGEYSL